MQSAGYNELALNCMDVLTAVAGNVCDAALLRCMLSTLCALLRPGTRPPLRLRLAAARLIARTFGQHATMPPNIFRALPHVHLSLPWYSSAVISEFHTLYFLPRQPVPLCEPIGGQCSCVPPVLLIALSGLSPRVLFSCLLYQALFPVTSFD